eukprot:4135737-Pyramimonas_sp.AAC.1
MEGSKYSPTRPKCGVEVDRSSPLTPFPHWQATTRATTTTTTNMTTVLTRPTTTTMTTLTTRRRR